MITLPEVSTVRPPSGMVQMTIGSLIPCQLILTDAYPCFVNYDAKIVSWYYGQAVWLLVLSYQVVKTCKEGNVTSLAWYGIVHAMELQPPDNC